MTDHPKDAGALEAEVAQRREDLAHTVDDLRDKLDVKSRAEDVKASALEQAHEITDRATTSEGRPRAGVVAAAAAALVVAVLVRRRRRHRQEATKEART
jgi:MYXO-CTERM domain-containing protein